MEVGGVLWLLEVVVVAVLSIQRGRRDGRKHASVYIGSGGIERPMVKDERGRASAGVSFIHSLLSLFLYYLTTLSPCHPV